MAFAPVSTRSHNVASSITPLRAGNHTAAN